MKRLLAAMTVAGVVLTAACATSGTLTGQKAQNDPGTSGLGASASTTAKAKPPAANVAAVGGSLHVTGRQQLDATVTLNSITSQKKGQSQYAQPPANGNYIVANVTIKVAGGTYDFNPLYFKLQSPDATTYSAFDGNAITAGFEPMMTAGSLGPGQVTRGLLVFDAPIAAGGHGNLQLTDPLGGVVGSWTL